MKVMEIELIVLGEISQAQKDSALCFLSDVEPSRKQHERAEEVKGRRIRYWEGLHMIEIC